MAARTFGERDAQRELLIRRAFRLELLTIGWMAIEAVVAVWSGVAAHSLSLTAFGLDSVIELASAGVLIWRLSSELRDGRERSEAAERIARRIGGGLLLALAFYVVAAAGWSLWRGRGQAFSAPGLAVALLAIPIMLFLARRKRAWPASSAAGRCGRTPPKGSPACGCPWWWSRASSPSSRSDGGGSTRWPRSRSSGFWSRKGARRFPGMTTIDRTRHPLSRV